MHSENTNYTLISLECKNEAPLLFQGKVIGEYTFDHLCENNAIVQHIEKNHMEKNHSEIAHILFQSIDGKYIYLHRMTQFFPSSWDEQAEDFIEASEVRSFEDPIIFGSTEQLIDHLGTSDDAILFYQQCGFDISNIKK